MKADTMPTKAPTKLRIVLDIANLVEIPEHQRTKRLDKKIQAYFDNSISEEPLAAQLEHFGTDTAVHMVKSELCSWLQNLYAEPTVVSITAMP